MKNCRVSVYNKREAITHQDSYWYSDSDSESESEEEEYEKCDHAYTVRSRGFKTCLTCGLEVTDATQFVREEHQNRTAPLRTIRTLEILRVEVEHIFEDLIFKLSHPKITIENSLGILLRTCERYMIPDDTVMGSGKRSHPFRISARPVSLCASLLWMKVRDLGIAMSMAKFSKRVGVSRSTIIGVNKQLNPVDLPKSELKESKQAKLKLRASLKERRKLDKTMQKVNKEIRKTVQKLKKERSARLKTEKEKERLLDELDFQRADRATQVNIASSKRSVKELRRLAKIYNVKGRSKAKTKDEPIRLFDENYA